MQTNDLGNIMPLIHLGYAAAIFLNITFIFEVFRIGRKDHKDMLRLDWISLVVGCVGVAFIVDSWWHLDMTMLKFVGIVFWNLLPIITVTAVSMWIKPYGASAFLDWMFSRPFTDAHGCKKNEKSRF